MIRELIQIEIPILTKILKDVGLEDDEICVSKFPTYVLEDEDGVAGFMTMRLENPQVSHLVHTYVKPEKRGLGYGKILGKLFKTLSKEKGCSSYITTISSDDNKTKDTVRWFFKGMDKFKEYKRGTKTTEFFRLGV